MSVEVVEVQARREALLRSAAVTGQVVQHLSTLAGGLAEAAESVPGICGWEGSAARAAGLHIALDTDRLSRLSTGFAAAAIATREHGEQLRVAAGVLSAGDPAQLARAEAVVAASSRRCAAALTALAASAPPRRTGFGEAAHRLSGWLGEMQVGAGEALLGLASTVVAASTTAVSVTPRDGALDADDVLDVARRPGALFAAVLDLPTWRENPARAVGHLAPEAVTALLTGGASAAARGRALGRLEADAATRSAAAQETRIASRGRLAAESRESLTLDALEEAVHGPARPGVVRAEGLSRVQRIQADEMYELSRFGEEALTERMRHLAAEVGGDLVGLGHRFKTPQSYGRKLASRAAEARKPWGAVLDENSDDLLRYTLVLNSSRYVSVVHDVAARLSREGYHLSRIFPAWSVRRNPYRGLNTYWQNVDSGRMFELQLHTPGSLAAATRAHPLYAEERLLPRASTRRAELTAGMRDIYATAEPPPGIEDITRQWQSLIPKPPPAPFPCPPDRAALHAVLAGAATGAAGTPSRR